MKVLVVSNMYPSHEKKYSGIFVKNQYEELKRIFDKNDTIEIFYMKRQFTSKTGSIVKYLKAFLIFVPKLFKKYDIIHLHYFFPLITLVWFYKKFHSSTKVIVTFHGSDINRQVTNKNVKMCQFFSRCIDFTIPVGKDLAQNMQSKLKLPIGKVLSVGVNKKLFYKSKNINKVFNFIFVGSFFEIKGIDILYKVIQELPKDISFCIVGKGEPYETKFKELIRNGYNITLKIDQSQDELRELFNKSEFLLQPSREEGFGLVVAEAMSCGIPVIVSEVGGFKEQVVDGKNGFFFSKDNHIELREKIAYLNNISDSQYDQLSMHAINSAKHLSLTSICKELLTIYRQLILS